MKKMVALTSSESDNDIFENVMPSTSRIIPKRTCTLKNTGHLQASILSDDSEETDVSLEEHINDLVESAVANVEPKQYNTNAGKYKRKFSLGRKTKVAKKFSKYRKHHESQQQYEARLKKSSLFKSKFKELEGGIFYKRKLEILKDKR